ncbi:MAG: hypothetical protein EP346_03650 [Bacteroidetes bacterium]|nr:MAG: hypothetical protein EP346_03650 [Bacteroidota bacterium]
MKPVYINDIGFVANLGIDPLSAWQKALSGESTFTQLEGYPVARVEHSAFAEFAPDYKPYRKLDRSTQLALFASQQLSRLKKDQSTLIAIGSSRGATETWEKAYENYTDSGASHLLDSPTTTAGQLASNVGAYLQMNSHVDIDQSITCASGLRAVADACAWLNAGFVSQAIAGGAEAPITPFTLSQMKALKIVGGEGEWPCRALDPNLNTNTMVLGEGSVLLHLSTEALEDAARIVGVGFGTETGMSATGLSPDGQCLQSSMKMACKIAGWEKPDAIIAHAPGTIKGDRSEIAGIHTLFGEEIPVTSSKYLTGHCFGSSGPVSIWMAIQMMKNNRWMRPDWAPQHEPETLNRIIVNAVGFGANAVSLAIEYNSAR